MENIKMNNMNLVSGFLQQRVIQLSLIVLAVLMSTSISAKDLPGATQTSYGVSSGGAFQFSMPIIIPQGTNGVQPNLSLSFSSAGGNGSAGVGWAVGGLSAITRCGKTFATNGKKIGVQHNTEDRFCLGGQQLILVSGSYGVTGSEYRTEIDQFSKILAFGSSTNVNGGNAPARWEVWTKGGTIQNYGTDEYSSNTTGQFKLPGTNSIHSWKLSRVNDRHGNYYEVTYRTADGLVDKIDYTTNVLGLVADKQVTFNYEARPDTRSRYLLGSKIDILDRLASITASKGGITIREYNLNYETAPITNKSRVTSITECGLNNACMPPIVVDWVAETAGFRDDANAKERSPLDTIHYDVTRDPDFKKWETKDMNYGNWVDVNGDGLVDLVYAVKWSDGTTKNEVRIKTETGWVDDDDWNLPEPLVNFQPTSDTGFAGFLPQSIKQGTLIDVNGDGLVDVVYAYTHHTNDDQNNHGRQVKKTYLNKGAAKGWQLTTGYALPDYMYSYVDNGNGVNGDNLYVLTVRGKFADVNGDGLQDYISAYHKDYGIGGTDTSNYPGSIQRTTWLNTGSGWSANSGYKLPDVFAHYNKGRSIQNGTLVDLNGDGLVDWARSTYHDEHTATGLPTKAAWLNTGSGWLRDDDYKLPGLMHQINTGSPWEHAYQRASMVDVNGDGLRDFVESHSYGGGVTSYTALNTGKGFVSNSSYNAPFAHLDYHDAHFDAAPIYVSGQYVDLNQDGLIDYLDSKRNEHGVVTNTYWRNTGSTWVSDTSYKIDGSNSTNWLLYDYLGHVDAKPGRGQFVDINNDGSVDWVKSRSDQTNESKISHVGKADQVEKITTTMGVEVIPTFLPLTDNDTLYQKGTGAAEQDALHIESVIYVTSSLQTSRPDGTGYNQTNYTYGGAQVHRLGRGFLGFAERTTSNVQTGMVQQQLFRQDYPFVGMSDQGSVTDNYGTVISESYSTPASTVINHGNGATTTFVHVSGSDSISRELGVNGGAVYKSVESNYTFDAYGNIDYSATRVRDNSGATLSTSINDTQYYSPDTVNWLIGLVANTTTTLSAPNKPSVVRYNEFFYNTDGTLDYSVREPNSTAAGIKLTTTYAYDSYGNIETETVSAAGETSRVNTIGYDAEHRLPISLSNSLSQGSSIVYHPQCDQPEYVTDLNDLVSKFTYDNFCRQTEVTVIGSNIINETIYETSNLSCTGSAFEAGCQDTPKLKITAKSTGQADVVSYFNSFSQSMLSTTTGMLGEEIRQRTEYDGLGRVYRSSQPYFSIDQAYYTEHAYDVLNRTTQTTLPFLNDAETANAFVSQDYSVDIYGRQVVTSTDTKGRDTKTFANALGQIVEIEDADYNSLKYVFDAQGNLSQTEDAAAVANTITVGYDLLGRRTSLLDPDMGYSSYVIDAFGQKTSQTDAMLQPISMEYDVLGRMVKRTVPNTQVIGTYDISEWFFDTAANGQGSIASITGPNGYAKSFTYDLKSRPASDTTTIKGESYTQSYAYNGDGMLASRTYPESGTGNVFAVHYNYQNGYLSSITNGDINSANCIEHWRANTYDALGRTKNETLGKIVTTTKTFNQAQGVLERIHSIMDVNGNDIVQDLNYTYDAGNNVKTRDDLIASVSESFTYDNLDRLRFHNIGAEQTEVRYDAIGNITYKSDVGDYSYAGSGGPHAVSRVDDTLLQFTNPIAKFNVKWEWNGVEQNKAQPAIQNQDFIYDANGNIKQSGDRWVWWTAFDKPTRMERYDASLGTNIGSDFEYDAAFNRIYKEKNTGINTPVIESTVYVGTDYERITDENGAITHRYTISTGGSVIQIDRDDGTSFDKPKYLLGDNLGSTNIILDAGGDVVQTLKFDPWGMRLNTGDTSAVNSITNRGYTGHEMDDEVSLTNMNARIYDPYLGRFLSADPILQNPFDMQSFNRYSYVGNNPLKYTDPTGNEKVDGGENQKPLEEVVVIGSKPPSPVGTQPNGVMTVAAIDLAGGGEALYFDPSTGRIGTEEDLWGGDKPSGEAESPPDDLDDIADDIDDARDKEDGVAGYGRLKNKARDEREEAEHDYVDLLLQDISDISDLSQPEWLKDIDKNAVLAGEVPLLGKGAKVLSKLASKALGKLILASPGILRYLPQALVRTALRTAGWINKSVKPPTALRGGWALKLGSGPSAVLQFSRAGGRHRISYWKLSGPNIGTIRIPYFRRGIVPGG